MVWIPRGNIVPMLNSCCKISGQQLLSDYKNIVVTIAVVPLLNSCALVKSSLSPNVELMMSQKRNSWLAGEILFSWGGHTDVSTHQVIWNVLPSVGCCSFCSPFPDNSLALASSAVAAAGGWASIIRRVRVRCHLCDRLSINLSSPTVDRHSRRLIQSSPPFLCFVFCSSSLLIEFIPIWPTNSSSSRSERPSCCPLLCHAKALDFVRRKCVHTGCCPLHSRLVAWLRA